MALLNRMLSGCGLIVIMTVCLPPLVDAAPIHKPVYYQKAGGQLDTGSIQFHFEGVDWLGWVQQTLLFNMLMPSLMTLPGHLSMLGLTYNLPALATGGHFFHHLIPDLLPFWVFWQFAGILQNIRDDAAYIGSTYWSGDYHQTTSQANQSSPPLSPLKREPSGELRVYKDEQGTFHIKVPSYYYHPSHLLLAVQSLPLPEMAKSEALDTFSHLAMLYKSRELTQSFIQHVSLKKSGQDLAFWLGWLHVRFGPTRIEPDIKSWLTPSGKVIYFSDNLAKGGPSGSSSVTKIPGILSYADKGQGSASYQGRQNTGRGTQGRWQGSHNFRGGGAGYSGGYGYGGAGGDGGRPPRRPVNYGRSQPADMPFWNPEEPPEQRVVYQPLSGASYYPIVQVRPAHPPESQAPIVYPSLFSTLPVQVIQTQNPPVQVIRTQNPPVQVIQTQSPPVHTVLLPDKMSEPAIAVMNKLLKAVSAEKHVVVLYGSHAQRAHMLQLYGSDGDLTPRDWDFKISSSAVLPVLKTLGVPEEVPSIQQDFVQKKDKTLWMHESTLSKGKLDTLISRYLSTPFKLGIKLSEDNRLVLHFKTMDLKDGTTVRSVEASFYKQTVEKKPFDRYLSLDFTIVDELPEAEMILFDRLGELAVLPVQGILGHANRMITSKHRSTGKMERKLRRWWDFESSQKVAEKNYKTLNIEDRQRLEGLVKMLDEQKQPAQAPVVAMDAATMTDTSAGKPLAIVSSIQKSNGITNPGQKAGVTVQTEPPSEAQTKKIWTLKEVESNLLSESAADLPPELSGLANELVDEYIYQSVVTYNRQQDHVKAVLIGGRAVWWKLHNLPNINRKQGWSPSGGDWDLMVNSEEDAYALLKVFEEQYLNQRYTSVLDMFQVLDYHNPRIIRLLLQKGEKKRIIRGVDLFINPSAADTAGESYRDWLPVESLHSMKNSLNIFKEFVRGKMQSSMATPNQIEHTRWSRRLSRLNYRESLLESAAVPRMPEERRTPVRLAVRPELNTSPEIGKVEIVPALPVKTGRPVTTVKPKRKVQTVLPQEVLLKQQHLSDFAEKHSDEEVEAVKHQSPELEGNFRGKSTEPESATIHKPPLPEQPQSQDVALRVEAEQNLPEKRHSHAGGNDDGKFFVASLRGPDATKKMVKPPASVSKTPLEEKVQPEQSMPLVHKIVAVAQSKKGQRKTKKKQARERQLLDQQKAAAVFDNKPEADSAPDRVNSPIEPDRDKVDTSAVTKQPDEIEDSVSAPFPEAAVDENPVPKIQKTEVKQSDDPLLLNREGLKEKQSEDVNGKNEALEVKKPPTETLPLMPKKENLETGANQELSNPQPLRTQETEPALTKEKGGATEKKSKASVKIAKKKKKITKESLYVAVPEEELQRLEALNRESIAVESLESSQQHLVENIKSPEELWKEIEAALITGQPSQQTWVLLIEEFIRLVHEKQVDQGVALFGEILQWLEIDSGEGDKTLEQKLVRLISYLTNDHIEALLGALLQSSETAEAAGVLIKISSISDLERYRCGLCEKGLYRAYQVVCQNCKTCDTSIRFTHICETCLKLQTTEGTATCPFQCQAGSNQPCDKSCDYFPDKYIRRLNAARMKKNPMQHLATFSEKVHADSLAAAKAGLTTVALTLMERVFSVNGISKQNTPENQFKVRQLLQDRWLYEPGQLSEIKKMLASSESWLWVSELISEPVMPPEIMEDEAAPELVTETATTETMPSSQLTELIGERLDTAHITPPEVALKNDDKSLLPAADLSLKPQPDLAAPGFLPITSTQDLRKTPDEQAFLGHLSITSHPKPLQAYGALNPHEAQFEEVMRTINAMKTLENDQLIIKVAARELTPRLKRHWVIPDIGWLMARSYLWSYNSVELFLALYRARYFHQSFPFLVELMANPRSTFFQPFTLVSIAAEYHQARYPAYRHYLIDGAQKWPDQGEFSDDIKSIIQILTLNGESRAALVEQHKQAIMVANAEAMHPGLMAVVHTLSPFTSEESAMLVDRLLSEPANAKPGIRWMIYRLRGKDMSLQEADQRGLAVNFGVVHYNEILPYHQLDLSLRTKIYGAFISFLKVGMGQFDPSTGFGVRIDSANGKQLMLLNDALYQDFNQLDKIFSSPRFERRLDEEQKKTVNLLKGALTGRMKTMMQKAYQANIGIFPKIPISKNDFLDTPDAYCQRLLAAFHMTGEKRFQRQLESLLKIKTFKESARKALDQIDTERLD